MLGRDRAARSTPGADKNDDTRDCAAAMRGMGVTRHVARHSSGGRSAIDGRTTRPGCGQPARPQADRGGVRPGKETGGMGRTLPRGLERVFTLRAPPAA